MSQEIPAKANRVLNVVLIIMLLICVRLWQLTVVQHEASVEQARRPQVRSQVIPANRGTIRDRFNLPLAQNRMQYNACVVYADIRQIPVGGGRRRRHVEELSKCLARELAMDPERIEDLIYAKAALLPNVPFVIKEDLTEEEYYRLKMKEGEWPGLCAERVAARVYPHGKLAGDLLGYMGSISREQYESHLREMQHLERFLSGVDEGRRIALPKGIHSIKEARHRLLDLRERAYSLRDQVGKAGIEKQCDEILRGFCGIRSFLVEPCGNSVRECASGKDPLPGQRVLLTLSSELQLYAEQLLAQHEPLRDGKSYAFDFETRRYTPLKQPWIKGGAIVALDPNTGEVLACASFPRVDPNDFVRAKRKPYVLQWLESEGHLAAVWEGRQPLTRERFSVLAGGFVNEECPLTFARYLDFILPEESPLRTSLSRIGTVRAATQMQRAMQTIIERAPAWHPRDLINALWEGPGDISFQQDVRAIPHSEAFREDPDVLANRHALDRYIGTLALNYDKLLCIDLCRLFVDESRMSASLLRAVGSQTLEEYHTVERAGLALRGVLQEMARELFHEECFRPWRDENGKRFLKEKRKEETERGSYQKPYLDYFDREERNQFAAFWKRHGWGLQLLLLTGKSSGRLPEGFRKHFGLWARELQSGAHAGEPWHESYCVVAQAIQDLDPALSLEYLQSFRSFSELSRPLLGKYRYLRREGVQREKHLAAAFYPRYGFGYGRSYAYRQALAQGSVFKILPAYVALTQRCKSEQIEGDWSDALNPLTMIDDPHRIPGTEGKWNVGFTKGGKPIPQLYKGGKMLRTHRRHVGEIDLIGALENSSNSYFALLAADHIQQPEDLLEAAASLSFGKATGIDLPGEYPGNLPSDLSSNPTGLYAFTDGQHSLVVTPLQTAIMFASLANGGKVLKPYILGMVAGTEVFRGADRLFRRRDYPFRHQLDLVGVPFGLFTARERGELSSVVRPKGAETVRAIELPAAVRNYLLSGLRQVVTGRRGGGNPSAARGYHDYPWMISDFRALQKEVVGKTSTAEAVENVDLDALVGTNKYNHLWFAGISFEPGEIVELDERKCLFGRPELVVVVALRFGDYGREAAPLAAQIVKRWREIKRAHLKGSQEAM